MELQFKNVTKDYGNVHAVEHVTHSMGKGVYGLLGVNGRAWFCIVQLKAIIHY